MKRIGIVLFVASLFVLIDGIVQNATNYHPGDSNQVLNTNLTIADGTTLIISGVILILVSMAVWLLGAREERRRRQATIRVRPPGADR